jgi:predicted NUDIX family NTP pyrophosphohydrolase
MGRKSEVSAGLLVHRAHEVLLAHPGGPYWTKKDAGAWTIPKGQVEFGDELLETALREFTEETGFTAHGPFVPLSPVRQKSGKTVHAFTCAGDFDPAAFVSGTFEIEWPPRSHRMQAFPEIDRLAWFGPDEAKEKILGYQLPFLRELEELLRKGG